MTASEKPVLLHALGSSSSFLVAIHMFFHAHACVEEVLPGPYIGCVCINTLTS